jgi:putative aldouronate transport system permease protein
METATGATAGYRKAVAGSRGRTRWRRGSRRTQTLPLHLMILPGLLLTLIYKYGPMFGIVIAFQEFVPIRGISGSEWVGWENFDFALSFPDTMEVVINTITISSGKIIFGLIAPIITALLLNELRLKVIKSGIQTIIYLPHFLSWVILGGILIEILSPSRGIIAHGFRAVGLEPIYFLGDNTWFPSVLVVTHVWKEFGFGTVIYLAALTGIDPTLYEAAMVDGASRWRQLWNVTLPGIRPIIVLVMTLSLGSILDAGFEQVLVLYSPQVYDSGDIIDTMVYRMGLIDAQYSIATAIGLFKSVVAFILISVSYWAAYRFARYRIF